MDHKSIRVTRNPVLENLSFDANSGALDYNGIRYMLIRPETVVEIQRVIEEKFGAEAAHEIFYRSGFRGTSLTAKKLLGSGLSPEKCLEAMFKMGSHLGWGNFKLLKTDRKTGVIEVTISASPFAEAYGSSEQPVCAILCGALAGIFSILKGKDYKCTEIGCVALEHGHCHFILKPITNSP